MKKTGSQPISGTLSVVHVITGLRMGGAERHLQRLATLGRHRNRVIALYETGQVADELREAGVEVELLCAGGRLDRVVAIPRLAARLRRLRPDVVHVHLLSGQAFGLPAARLAGVPVRVSTEHSVMADQIEGLAASPPLRLLYRGLERLSTRTVAVSATTRHRLIDNWGVPPERVEVIDLGIDFGALRFDPEARCAVRAELGLGAGDVVIGAVGRLSPVKRFDVLLRSLAPLLRAGGHRLVLVGEGELRRSLEDVVRAEGLEGRVQLTGPRADLNRMLNAFDVLVSTSRDETFGLAVLEALANGLPTVFEECPALEDLALAAPALQQVSPELDLTEESAALRTAVDRVGGMGRQDVPEVLQRRYSAEARVADVDDLYERLARGARVPVPLT